MRSYLIALVFLLTVNTAKTQDLWDLEKCLSYAIENSIDMQLSDLAVSNGWQFSAGVLLYNGGRLKNTVAQGLINEAASKEDRSSTINNITLNVVAAYFEVLFAKDNFSNINVQLKTITDQITQMEKLVEAGSRAKFEIYDLQAQQATTEQQITAAQNRIDLAKLNLKGVMNLPLGEDIDVAPPPVEQKVYSDPELESFEEILERVLTARPELRAFDLRLQSAEKGVEIAKAQLIPSVSFGGNFFTNFSNQAKVPNDFIAGDPTLQNVTINGDAATIGFPNFTPTNFSTIPYFDQINENNSFGFGFTVSVPIYNNYSAKGSIERAKLNVLNQSAQREQYSITLRNTLGQLITDVKAAKRNLEASDKVLEAREIAFDNAQKRYDLGAINSFDYTSIQDQLNQARTDQIISKYDYMLKVKVLDFYQGFPVSLK